MIGIAPVVIAPRRVSEERKQLTEGDLILQERLKKEVCSHLYLENYPTGYSGTFEPLRDYRCGLTGKSCVAKQGVLGTFALVFRNSVAASEGLNIKVAERCPSRELNSNQRGN